MLTRRDLLRTAAGAIAVASTRSALARPEAAPPPPRELTLLDLTVEGRRDLGNRFTLFIPNHLARGERVPLLVLLHGLGETGDQRMGAFAWQERYGLGAAYDRLRRAPVARTSARRDFSDRRLVEVNAALAAHPFRGLAIACPYTPN